MFFLIGCLTIACLYNLFIFLGRRKKVTYLYFSLYCIAIMINEYNTDLNIWLFTTNILAIIFTLFIGSAFKRIRKITNYFVLLLFLYNILSIVYLVSGIKIFSTLFWALLGGTGLLYLIIVIYSFIKNKKTLFQKLVFTGIILQFSVYITASVLNAFFEGYSVYFSYFGTSAITFFFMCALAVKSNQDYKKLRGLTNHLEQKVDDRTRELKEANESKTTFFINLAHETKGPLTLINNYLDSYIKEQKIDNDKIKIVKMNIEKLTRDMVNFLDSEKIARGKELYTHDKIFNVSDMLGSEVKLFRPTAERKEIIIHSSIEKNITIKASDTAVSRIIRNLLDNAVKYTGERGEIHVSMKSIKGVIKLVISDTGIGIPEEQLKNITKPYYQIGGRKFNYQGMGMGLDITRKLIDSLKGDMQIESKENNGTTVSVTFNEYDLKVTETVEDFSLIDRPTDIPLFDLEEEKINPERETILIVEDELAIISLLKEELQSDYNLFYAVNGEEALKKLPVAVPNIIISDVMMDVMDGFDFISSIPEEYKDIPFIFLTARTNSPDKISGIHRGALDYIYKPFVMEEVREKIKRHLEHKTAVEENIFKKIRETINAKERTTKSIDRFCADNTISNAEKKVLVLLKEQLQNKEIAQQLFISENTVKNHILLFKIISSPLIQ